jgi:hypothetical protein
MVRRSPFRPDALGPLEPRLVPSHVAPIHRVVIPPPPISTSSPTWSGARLPHHRYSTSVAANVVVQGPDAMGMASGSDPAVRTIEIRLQVQGDSPVSSATIAERLPRKLAYVAGSAQGSDVGPVDATKARGGATVLRWNLQDSLAVGATTVISFQARYGR